MTPDHDFPFTHAVALASTASPLWLSDLSTTASAILPVLGAAWLLLQAYVFIRNNFFRKNP